MDICNGTPNRLQNLTVEQLAVCELVRPKLNAILATAIYDGKAPVITLSRVGAPTTVTLPAPASPNDNGKTLTIVTTTAQAHVVAGPLTDETGVNRATATFDNPAPAVGFSMTLVASNGRWYVQSQRGVTYA